MGAANVIPGVSGGTVAFITGIYERLIAAVRAFDLAALRLLFTGQWVAFARHVDFAFLALLGAGVFSSLISLALLLKWLLASHEIWVFAFFFGLILASIYFVGFQVKRWSAGPVVSALIGAGVAVGMAFMKPASESDNVIYLGLCGVVAMASMIIPGLSGSFVLLLMGNYELIMIESVTQLSALDFGALRVLVPVGIGALIGVVTLSRVLTWVFRKHHDVAVALMTGFVAGSLLIIWPWKREILVEFVQGDETKSKAIGYEWYAPPMEAESWLAMAFGVAGFLLVWLIERWSARGHPAESK